MILRNWWRGEILRVGRSLRDPRLDDPVPDFVYPALAWVLNQDVSDWPPSAVRWKVRLLYLELDFACMVICPKFLE